MCFPSCSLLVICRLLFGLLKMMFYTGKLVIIFGRQPVIQSTAWLSTNTLTMILKRQILKWEMKNRESKLSHLYMSHYHKWKMVEYYSTSNHHVKARNILSTGIQWILCFLKYSICMIRLSSLLAC